MPISYSIDTAQRAIFVKWHGAVTRSDLADHFQKLLTDGPALALCRCVADLRGAAIQLTGDDVQSVIQVIVRPLLGDRKWMSAVVAPDPVAFGTSRQFQAYSQGFNRSAIFSDEGEALTWLRAQ